MDAFVGYIVEKLYSLLVKHLDKISYGVYFVIIIGILGGILFILLKRTKSFDSKFKEIKDTIEEIKVLLNSSINISNTIHTLVQKTKELIYDLNEIEKVMQNESKNKFTEIVKSLDNIKEQLNEIIKQMNSNNIVNANNKTEYMLKLEKLLNLIEKILDEIKKGEGL